MRIKFASSISIFFLLLSFSLNVMSAPEDDAKQFIQKLNLNLGLYNMSRQVAKNTQTYRMLIDKVGEKEADLLLVGGLQATFFSYQSEWEKNLALSYLEFFTPEELNSLSNEREKSPYFSKFKEKQSSVGSSMQSRSKVILATVVAESLEKAYTKASAKK